MPHLVLYSLFYNLFFILWEVLDGGTMGYIDGGPGPP